MKLELNSTNETHIIRAYGPGHVVVNQRELTGSLILTPDTIATDWPPQSFESATYRKSGLPKEEYDHWSRHIIWQRR